MLWCLAFVFAADAQSVVGVVRVSGSAANVSVELADGARLPLEGEALAELRRLSKVKVEIVGVRHADRVSVATYRILDVGGGERPLVGELVFIGGRLALRDGDGSALPLSAPAKLAARMARSERAKVWLTAERLLSGQLRVKRYGVLRDPPPAHKPPKPPPATP